MDKFMALAHIHIRMDSQFKENGIWASFKNEVKYYYYQHIYYSKCFLKILKLYPKFENNIYYFF